MNSYENLQLYSFFIQDCARKIILIFDENSEMTTVTARHMANVGFPSPQFKYRRYFRLYYSIQFRKKHLTK